LADQMGVRRSGDHQARLGVLLCGLSAPKSQDAPLLSCEFVLDGGAR
jgi:hypothetical protein